MTGVMLSNDDEVSMRAAVGKTIEAGNSLLGYSRTELTELCGVKSAQFSKIIKGEAWMNIGSQGLWGFATGISPAHIAKFVPLKADKATCIAYFLNGHLHHLENDEFEIFHKLVCRRFAVGYKAVDTLGVEAVPNLRSESWRDNYLKDMIEIVAKRLVELRTHLNISQKSFADIMNVSLETVKHYESGDDVNRLSKGIFTTYRLFTSLNVNPIELTVGSLHHKIRYIQDQRHDTLVNLARNIDYNRYADLKRCALGIKSL